MNIFISGSLAYDRIMNFPGHFADHILPNKIHVLNVCFNINGLVERFGGTAGNIAHSLALLGEKPFIVATCGDDFTRYRNRLQQSGLPLDWIKTIAGVLTAGAYITTDMDDNQITAFNPGAMAFESDLPPVENLPANSYIFIGPGNKNDMRNFADTARKRGIPFFFDPGQSLNIWEGEELRDVVEGAHCFISNDYELSLFLQMTRFSMKDLYARVENVVTTIGPEGCILDRGGDKIFTPAVKVKNPLDPTGAGDAFRAGLLKGLIMDLPWEIACQMGVVIAAYAVEHHGTQEHQVTWESFRERYETYFGILP